METPAMDSPPARRQWSPRWLLGIFCAINVINYLERGAIGSVGVNGVARRCTDGICSPGSGIQGDLNLSNGRDGLIASSFMFGLLGASIVFAMLAKRVNPFRLIGFGLTVWTVAVVCCGFTDNFWSIIVCRILVGVGEASFVSLAAPYIEDNAPPGKKGTWISIFYMFIPVGFAVGYIFGGGVGKSLGWRASFYIEGALMLPFAVLAFVMKPPQMKGFAPVDSNTALTTGESLETTVSQVQVAGSDGNKDESGDTSSDESSKPTIIRNIWNKLKSFCKDLTPLCNKVYIVTVLGYVLNTFVMGAYAYWGPKAGYIIYGMDHADYVFGVVTVFCGVFGTLVGGFIFDKMDQSISNAFKLLAVTTFFGAIFCFLAFCFKNMYAFIGFFSVGEFFIFAAQGPVNLLCMRAVSPSMRPLSMAVSTVLIHLFGDVPSTYLVGIVQDKLNNWRKTSLILTAILFLPAAIWFIGIFFKRSNNYNEDVESVITANGNGTNTAARLLNGETKTNSESGGSKYKAPSVDGETAPITTEHNGETVPVTDERSTTPLVDGENSEAKSSPST